MKKQILLLSLLTLSVSSLSCAALVGPVQTEIPYEVLNVYNNPESVEPEQPSHQVVATMIARNGACNAYRQQVDGLRIGDIKNLYQQARQAAAVKRSKSLQQLSAQITACKRNSRMSRDQRTAQIQKLEKERLALLAAQSAVIHPEERFGDGPLSVKFDNHPNLVIVNFSNSLFSYEGFEVSPLSSVATSVANTSKITYVTIHPDGRVEKTIKVKKS